MIKTISNFTILLNARRIAAIKYDLSPNWVIACEMFNVGSTSGIRICRNAGVDPDSCVVDKVNIAEYLVQP